MSTGLPLGWEVRWSNSKNLPYFFNPTLKESKWEPPNGSDADALRAYIHANFQPSAPAGKIRAAHLLVKHKDSRRPSSWKSENITRTKEEGREMLEGYEKRIKSGEVGLADLATTESDCNSARKRGDLGFFGPGEMQKEFQDAAFALKPGEVSGIVETQSGLHLIERLD